jgi:hypothetical protein
LELNYISTTFEGVCIKIYVCEVDHVLILIKFEGDFVKLATLLAFLQSSRWFLEKCPRGGLRKCYTAKFRGVSINYLSMGGLYINFDKV